MIERVKSEVLLISVSGFYVKNDELSITSECWVSLSFKLWEDFLVWKVRQMDKIH